MSRFALLVGNNDGDIGSPRLYFAEDDARKMEDVLTTLGGVHSSDVQLLLGGSRNQVLRALAELRVQVDIAHAQGDQAMVVFYYSGHADDERLQLGRSWLTWDELNTLLERTNADVRMAFLDACQSGSMTRAKGGTRAPGFVIDLSERLETTGQVVIASSASNEASQESDEIAGSYFTHYLVSALSGAADEDGDDRVTLSEAYGYVYRETVFETASSRVGAQHPTYEFDMAGTGEVVLTDLNSARSALVFPVGMAGRFAVFDEQRRAFVAEVDLDGTRKRRISLRPGRYLVQERYPTHLRVADLELSDGETVSLDGVGFASVEYEEDVAKGAIDRRLRRARAPTASIHWAVGSRTFMRPDVSAAWFPKTGISGTIVRWTWDEGPWVSVDTLYGQSVTELQIDGLSYGIPVMLKGATAGGTVGVGIRPGRFTLGVGVRVAATWFERSFPEQTIDAQQLLTVAPGLDLRGGVRAGRFEAELDIRAHYLPYVEDGIDQGVGFTELALTAGYRF